MKEQVLPDSPEATDHVIISADRVAGATKRQQITRPQLVDTLIVDLFFFFFFVSAFISRNSYLKQGKTRLAIW
jgi:hypothetical protein